MLWKRALAVVMIAALLIAVKVVFVWLKLEANKLLL